MLDGAHDLPRNDAANRQRVTVYFAGQEGCWAGKDGQEETAHT